MRSFFLLLMMFSAPLSAAFPQPPSGTQQYTFTSVLQGTSTASFWRDDERLYVNFVIASQDFVLANLFVTQDDVTHPVVLVNSSGIDVGSVVRTPITLSMESSNRMVYSGGDRRVDESVERAFDVSRPLYLSWVVQEQTGMVTLGEEVAGAYPSPPDGAQRFAVSASVSGEVYRDDADPDAWITVFSSDSQLYLHVEPNMAKGSVELRNILFIQDGVELWTRMVSYDRDEPQRGLEEFFAPRTVKLVRYDYLFGELTNPTELQPDPSRPLTVVFADGENYTYTLPATVGTGEPSSAPPLEEPSACNAEMQAEIERERYFRAGFERAKYLLLATFSPRSGAFISTDPPESLGFMNAFIDVNRQDGVEEVYWSRVNYLGGDRFRLTNIESWDIYGGVEGPSLSSSHYELAMGDAAENQPNYPTTDLPECTSPVLSEREREQYFRGGFQQARSLVTVRFQLRPAIFHPQADSGVMGELSGFVIVRRSDDGSELMWVRMSYLGGDRFAFVSAEERDPYVELDEATETGTYAPYLEVAAARQPGYPE